MEDKTEKSDAVRIRRSLPGRIFPVGIWRTAFLLFKQPDEAGIIPVADLLHDILYGEVCFDKQLFRKGDTLADDQSAEGKPGFLFDQDG